MSWFTFNDLDLYLNESDPETPYRRRKEESKTTLGWGQRKLLIEIEFVTSYWDRTRVQKPIFVYAGAAPGDHIPIMCLLFPEITFHLYDPSPFSITPTSNIILHQEFFTDEIAKSWSGNPDVFFLSDIRSGDFTQLNQKENEAMVQQNMRDQERWHRIINSPNPSFLKFRLPYAYPGIPHTFMYLSGKILKQPWNRQTSTETRLIVQGFEETEYNIVKYENQLFHHNAEIRERNQYFSVISGEKKSQSGKELLNDYDSTAEAKILCNYLQKYTNAEKVTQESIDQLSEKITEMLNHYRNDKRTLNSLREKQRHFRKTEPLYQKKLDTSVTRYNGPPAERFRSQQRAFRAHPRRW